MRVDVGRGRHVVQRGFDRAHCTGCCACRCKLGGGGFHNPPQFNHVRYELGIERAGKSPAKDIRVEVVPVHGREDACASARANLEQMLVHQDLDCFAHYSATYPERHGEVVLDGEHFVGGELPAHDATTELIDDVLVQAQREFSAMSAHSYYDNMNSTTSKYCNY